jgi:two-component system sensor histidine kinase KdpD
MDAGAARPGRLKVFLGYAAGVGKTFRMLEEVAQLAEQGADVVVGYFEPHGRQDTIAKTRGLELLPRRAIEYRGCTFEEMDTDAVLGRQPAICAVDELAHTNVPGSPRKKRWEDVILLLEAGIDVLTTMNIQHLESLNDRVREISGIGVRETVPDWILKEAQEVVLVDLPPRALLNRLARGVVYPPEKVAQALDHFFKEPTLAALREMALRHAAHEVDLRQEEPPVTAAATAEPAEARERVLIHVTEDPSTAALIRRGRRVADYLKGECFAVAVLPPRTRGQSAAPRPSIDEHLSFARRLHIETHLLEADDVALALVEFARSRGITQVFLARPRDRPLPLLGRKETAMRVIELARDMQVTVVAERRLPTEKQP